MAWTKYIETPVSMMQYNSTAAQTQHYNLHEGRIYNQTFELECISFTQGYLMNRQLSVYSVFCSSCLIPCQCFLFLILIGAFKEAKAEVTAEKRPFLLFWD